MRMGCGGAFRDEWLLHKAMTTTTDDENCETEMKSNFGLCSSALFSFSYDEICMQKMQTKIIVSLLFVSLSLLLLRNWK